MFGVGEGIREEKRDGGGGERGGVGEEWWRKREMGMTEKTGRRKRKIKSWEGEE